MKSAFWTVLLFGLLVFASTGQTHDDVIGPHFGGDGTIHDNGIIIESFLPIYRPPRTYSQGFNDGLECIALVNLEMDIKGERKTFGEMANLCRKRNLLN